MKYLLGFCLFFNFSTIAAASAARIFAIDEAQLPYPFWYSQEEQPSYANKDICEMSSEDFIEKSKQHENLSAPQNSSGPLLTGLCWWHSKLQRSAIYLSVFDQPQAAKPNALQVWQIFDFLAQRRGVVRIPGYKNWNQFTRENAALFKNYLSAFELRDTAHLEFLKGIKWAPKTSPKSWTQIREDIQVRKRIPFVMLNLPGPSAHAWLINAFDGANLTMIDSNFPEYPMYYNTAKNFYIANFAEQDEKASWGAIEMDGSGLYDRFGEPITLYVQNENHFTDFTRAIRSYCKKDTAFTSFQRQFSH